MGRKNVVTQQNYFAIENGRAKRQVGHDKGFYVVKNISENDKIKVGNMLRHLTNMSQHKVQKST